MSSDQFKSIAEPSEGIFKDKGSKFLAFAYPITTEEEVKEYIKLLKKQYYDARHHVYAFRLGADMNTFRCSDDGEPSNSSGPPVLGQIQSLDLTNILIVVIRYFGGTKLGVPGLINAYRSAAQDALENATILTYFEQDVFTIAFGYTVMNDVMRILKDEQPEQKDQSFDNTCTITLSIRKSEGEQLRNKLLKVEGLSIQ